MGKSLSGIFTLFLTVSLALPCPAFALRQVGLEENPGLRKELEGRLWEVISIMRQLLDGLHFLFSHGVAHSDFQDDNVLLNDAGQVSIIDVVGHRKTMRWANCRRMASCLMG